MLAERFMFARRISAANLSSQTRDMASSYTRDNDVTLQLWTEKVNYLCGFLFGQGLGWKIHVIRFGERPQIEVILRVDAWRDIDVKLQHLQEVALQLVPIVGCRWKRNSMKRDTWHVAEDNQSAKSQGFARYPLSERRTSLTYLPQWYLSRFGNSRHSRRLGRPTPWMRAVWRQERRASSWPAWYRFPRTSTACERTREPRADTEMRDDAVLIRWRTNSREKFALPF